jgi:hypothetical protein
MNTQTNSQCGNAPLCPHCNSPLVRKGKVGDFGYYKKWIEEWHCITHGKVDPPETPAAKSQIKS